MKQTALTATEIIPIDSDSDKSAELEPLKMFAQLCNNLTLQKVNEKCFRKIKECVMGML